MKIVFDKCVPRPLRRHLPGHEIRTAEEMGWGTLVNGDLIHAAEQEFEAIITSDQQWKYQQNLSGRKLAILVLPTNYLPAVLELAPKIRAALEKLRPGDYVEIEFKK
jgi:predicted nuclease of predicted toxin-antitoxin system